MYKKPKIKITKIKNQFFSESNRFFDSLDSLNQKQSSLANACGDPCTCSSCSCGCGQCFLPGTKVLLANNKYKEIQKIESDEMVYSYNFQKKSNVPTIVHKLLVHPNTLGGYFLINGTIRVTGNHRVWTNGEMWQRVDLLNLGDRLLTSAGKEAIITEMKQLEGTNTVYNLHINAKEHNYFADGILAHNPKL